MPAPSSPDRSLRLRNELIILTAIGLVFVALCVWIIGKEAPLGHDEAVYALKARTMVDGSTSAYFWNDYRAPGLPLVLNLSSMVESSDAVMRLTVVAFGGLLILLVWLIGRTVFDQRVGLIAAAGTALTPAVLGSSTAVWPDVPGAAIGMAALAVLVLSTRRDRMSWWVLLAAPLTIAATVTRFGAPMPIGIGAIGIALWRWTVVRRSLLRVAALAIVTGGGILAVLVFPAVLGTTTSPLSSLATFSESNSPPIYQGFVDYAQQYEFLILTPTGVLLILGIIWGAVRVRQSTDLRFLLVAGIGVATALGIALTLHGEYRYLTPALPWLWIAAAAGITQAWPPLRNDVNLPIVGVVIVAALLGGFADGDIEVSRNIDRFVALRTVSGQIDEATDDRSCGIVTSYVPQVAWYSHCVTARFSDTEVRLTSDSFPTNPVVFVFLVQDGKRQPQGDLLASYLEAADGPCTSFGEQDDGPLRFVEACRVAGR